jgi:predicted alpha/beta superfamily hydrolase
LTEELRPRIETTYATDRTDTILFGDSLGGLFALHVLFNHPGSYRTYLVGSPSITFSECAILKDEHKLAAPLAEGTVSPRVFITVGAYEETVADHVKVHPSMTREQKQAYLSTAAMVTNASALADRLKALDAPAGFELETVLFERETHLSVIPACISRGVRVALPA